MARKRAGQPGRASLQTTTIREEQRMERLWSRHCGTLLVSPQTAQSGGSGGGVAAALDYADPIVSDMWQLFYPLLAALPLLPLPRPLDVLGATSAPTTDEDRDDDIATVAPPTHIFYLDIAENDSETAAMVSRTSPDERMTADMRHALLDQPRVVVPLLEFFMAVLHDHEGEAEHPEATEAESAARHRGGAIGRAYACLVADTAAPLPFDQLGASHLGRLVTIKGTIVRMSPSRILCVRITYRCNLCHAAKTIAAEDGVLVYPGPCSGRCRGYKWTPLVEAAVCEEVQLLKLQEQTDVFDTSMPTEEALAGGAGTGGGGINKVVEVELRHPLLERVTVGDDVCVCGLLGTRRGERKAGSVQQICLRASSIESTRRRHGQLHRGDGAGGALNANSSHANTEEGADGIGGFAQQVMPGVASVWSPEESGQFYEMARHPQWFQRISASVAPSIFGLEMVKEALLLAVIGGSTQKIGTRSSIHLLMVGDPGLGKSQLLRAACTLAPRSALVCAHTSSSCGLTMTLARDPISGETTFEAGAVVHGDGGVTCIDEIDKGTNEHKALLEVMEQESVSIAKAGMIFSMPVHTSVLAAGNPIGGRFDLSKTVSQNINLSPALLSRFDIVVCLRDVRRGQGYRGESGGGQGGSSDASRCHEGGGAGGGRGQLTDHILRMHRQGPANGARGPEAGTGSGVLPHALVQRFILFSRTQCNPTLSTEACVVLKTHYLTERAKTASAAVALAAGGGAARGGGGAELPITPRYLQGLIRVAEARAKVELRHEVSNDDAAYAVQLLQGCLHSFDGVAHPSASDGAGRVGGGGGRKKNQRDQIIDLLKAQIVENGGVNKLGYAQVLEACESAGCKNPTAMLHQLNEFGVLLKSGEKYTLRGV